MNYLKQTLLASIVILIIGAVGTVNLFSQTASNADMPQKASFKLTAKIDGLQNSTWFSFNSNGKIGRDRYDAVKLAPLDYVSYLSISSIVEDIHMDINNLPIELNEEIEIPLLVAYYIATANGYAAGSGEVTIVASGFSGISEDWTILLRNYDADEEVDLLETDTYTFLLGDIQPKQLSDAKRTTERTGTASDETDASSGLAILIIPAGNNDNPDNPEDSDDPEGPTALQPEERPFVLTLNQNYPNPFNPATTIKYSVPQTGFVQLAIYNVMGRKVAELVNGQKTAGNYAVVWDAGQAASGLYFYRLNANGQTITRRMTLIK